MLTAFFSVLEPYTCSIHGLVAEQVVFFYNTRQYVCTAEHTAERDELISHHVCTGSTLYIELWRDEITLILCAGSAVLDPDNSTVLEVFMVILQRTQHIQ